jgi:hypothetical protein
MVPGPESFAGPAQREATELTAAGPSFGGTMSNEYQLVDGTPRYGSRSEAYKPEATAPASGIRAEETAEAAARLGLDHLAAAIDRRLTSHWSDKEDPLVAGLRKAHPEELSAAAPWSSSTSAASGSGA